MKDLLSITALLTDFVKTSSLNTVKELDNLCIYDEPLVAIASAEDKLFLKLKEPSVIGPNHMTPKEWLPEAEAVISYFLPFSSRVRKANRLNDGLPSVEWLYGRIEGETFNNALRKFLAGKFTEAGIKAIVPSFDPRYESKNYRSNWSERHVAFIAGLGTFGLSKSIITKKGSAGRFGSVIVQLPIEPTVRPYQGLYEYCNDCGACIRRCPIQAITIAGKEHPPCEKFLMEYTAKRFAPRYGCGKCQTAVPCEAGIPGKNI